MAHLLGFKNIGQTTDQVFTHVEWVEGAACQFEGLADTSHFIRKHKSISSQRETAENSVYFLEQFSSIKESAENFPEQFDTEEKIEETAENSV